MEIKLLLLFALVTLSLAGSDCDTPDGIVFDCECCINGYPYDECVSKDECTHLLVWILSSWFVFFLGYIIIYCYARHKYSQRIETILNRARIASAEKTTKEPGVQKTQYIETNQNTQTFEVTKDQL